MCHSARTLVAAAAALLLLCCCLGCVRPAAALKFIVVPLPSDNSHVLDTMAVAAQLQARGHAVHVVSDAASQGYLKVAAARHTSNSTAEALRYIHVDLGVPTNLDAVLREVGPMMQRRLKTPGVMGALQLLLSLPKLTLRPCQAVAANATLMAQLRSLEADAVMAVSIAVPIRDCCGCLLSHALDLPWVDVLGSLMVAAPPSVPQMMAGTTPADLLTWRGWARNWAAYAAMRYVLPNALGLWGDSWAAARQQLGLPQVQGAGGLVARVRAALERVMRGGGAGARRMEKCEAAVQTSLNTFLLEYPRPLQPNQVLVGPGSPRPAQPISPPEVAAFVESARAGLVLVATGTLPLARLLLSATDMRQLAQGFALLAPTRVLWAIKPQHLPEGVTLAELTGGSDNIKFTPWVDYNDVLGHPNTRLFVSHCGWHSVNEAAYHGVPVVAIPFQFEQAENARRLQHRGLAEVMPRAHALRAASNTGGGNESFVAVEVAARVRKVLGDARYAAAGRAMAEAMQAYAAARQPYARAADEIELAVRAAKMQARWAGAPGASQRRRQQHSARSDEL